MFLQPWRPAYPNTAQPLFGSHVCFQGLLEPQNFCYVAEPVLCFVHFQSYHLPPYRFQYWHPNSAGPRMVNPIGQSYGGNTSTAWRDVNPRRLPPSTRNTSIRPVRRTGRPAVVRKWVPKKKLEKASTFEEGSSSKIPFPQSPHQGTLTATTTTTLMIKNIPNQFGRSDILGILKDYCFAENLSAVLRSEPMEKSSFDFLYLPMDFSEFWINKKTSNLGYAFVNFTSAAAAERFCKKYNNFKWKVKKQRKTCEITRADTQGMKALEKKFRHKIFWCHSHEYLPVILSPPCDGVMQSSLVTVGVLAGEPKSKKKK